MKFSLSSSQIIPSQDWFVASDAQRGMHILDKLNAVLGDKVLIIGCSDASMATAIKDRGAYVVGIDTNMNVVKDARETGLDARLMSGENLIFENEFDAVVSYSALHWMRRPDKVISGVWRALKNKGRFVGELGAYQNISKVIDAFLTALDNRGIDGLYLIPWYFPSVEDYNRRLVAKGFLVQDLEETLITQALNSPLGDWLRGRVGESFASILPEEERENFFAEVERDLKAKLPNYGEGEVIEYRTLRFIALKKDEE